MKRLIVLFRRAVFLALAGLVLGALPVAAREAPGDGIAAVRLADLPAEARETLALIRRGGPFPYPRRDGATFGNYEKLLPPRPRGYYREYTVPTPGARDRGARRIIAGRSRKDDAGEFYYTQDHYRSFRRILE
jgi:ribonuclease T1